MKNIMKFMGINKIKTIDTPRAPIQLDERHLQKELENLLLNSQDIKFFGSALANILEHRPASVGDAINDRLIHYKWLSQLGDILRAFSIDLVIDGGANTGQFATTLFGSSLFGGEIHSYEPLSAEFNIMKSHQKHYPNWQVFNFALGDTEGDFEIEVSGETSSFLEKTETMNKITGGSGGESKEIARIRRLDALYADVLSRGARRVMLKLDVQGYEERALRSAGQYIDKFKIIQVELSGSPMYRGDTRIPNFISMLEDLGYVLLYCKNNYVVRGCIAVDFDFIFCRRSEFDAIHG